ASAVVIPGTSAVRTAASASATTSPARRMTRICSIDLSSIRSLPNIVLRSDGRRTGFSADGGEDPVGDVLDRADAVDLHEEATLGVLRRHGGRLLRVDVEATPDDVLGVVDAPLDRCAAQQPLGDDLRVGC